METIILKYDEKNPLIISILNSAILAGAKVEDQTTPKSGIEMSLNEIKAGKVYKAKSVKDLMNKI
jgi:hypothetical protein